MSQGLDRRDGSRANARRRPPHAVIVGGGFGGLWAARALKDAPVRVTLVDKQNHHLFQPLLYQVATAGLSPGQIAIPIRGILRKHRNTRVLMGEAVRIDPDRQRVCFDTFEIAYDYLILATGARHGYFTHPEWEWLAPGLKTVEDAIEIRRRVFLAFEEAERETDPERRDALLTFVIVGGGPTGVELAGTLAEIARKTLAQDFRRIDPRRSHVILLEGTDRVLPPYPPSLSRKAESQLRRLGVDVRTNKLVTDVSPQGVAIGDDWIPARTVLWAAGVVASPLAESLGAPRDKQGRVIVEPDLTIPGHPNVFVIGDLASFLHQGDEPLPGTAPVAMQEGTFAAQAILRDIEDKPRGRFHYRHRGTMATIGRAAGVADLGPIKLAGPIAWLAWLFVHLWFLIGFENRLLVLLQWAWSYITFQRNARLITGTFRPPVDPPQSHTIEEHPVVTGPG
jgi:NADH dehydrogenase